MPAMPRKCVLLISEQPQFFEEPENAFQSRGCDVFTALSWSEGAAFISAHNVDLVIGHGVPSVDPSQIAGERDVILVCDGDAGAWAKVDGVHVLQAPVQGRKLLKLTSSLLGVNDRKYISILVQVRVGSPKPTTIFGKSRDLSDGGILVETNQTLMLHDKVVVSFLIPGAERMIQSESLVMREVVRPGGARRYGLKFLSLGEEDQGIVREFLAGSTAT